MRTAEEIRNEIAKLEGELATMSGDGLLVWDGRDGNIADCPPGGATLTVRWAIEESSYCKWYPTVEAAEAALLAIARSEGRAPREDNWYVDLTAPGCHTSRAYVTRLGETEA